MQKTKKLNINRLKDGKMELVEDTIISEYPLTIFLNGSSFSLL